MHTLEEKINAADASTVSLQTQHGIVTPIMWTSQELRDKKVALTFRAFLESITGKELSIESWDLMYCFFVASHASKDIGSRLSVCEFADKLRLSGLENPGFFAGLYGACMNLLEVYDEQLRKAGVSIPPRRT